MNLTRFNAFDKKGLLEECKTFFSATTLAALVFGSVYAYDAYAANPETETLTVTIAETVTFAASTNSFGSLTPGTPLFATTTTDVLTNAPAWNITMTGTTETGNTALDLNTDASIGITDDTQWVPGAATTSAGNATTVTAGDDVLAFRVMSASGSVPFRASTWWGTSDVNYNGSQLWAGIASTTASNKRIGAVSVYSATNIINTVQYYLDVPTTQVAGAYAGDLTYTWVTGT
ncbi:MAG: hypothetical protein HYT94_01375 [Parcubacteria group bacterium]|nr:hypothetical protein [Parcubacteria group bacterium]